MLLSGDLIVDGYVDEVMRKARQRIMLNIRVRDEGDRNTDAAAALLESHDLVDSVNVTSSRMILPLLPVPDTRDRSTPSSRANRRIDGLA